MTPARRALFWMMPVSLFLALGVWISRMPPDPVPPEGSPDFVSNRRLPGARGGDDSNVKFGLAESQRRAIHRELASHVNEWWRTVEKRFPDEWSRHDDFANYFARHVREQSRRWALNPSIVYLVYDEGVREGWEGPQGQRFPSTWAPLKPRTR